MIEKDVGAVTAQLPTWSMMVEENLEQTLKLDIQETPNNKIPNNEMPNIEIPNSERLYKVCSKPLIIGKEGNVNVRIVT